MRCRPCVFLDVEQAWAAAQGREHAKTVVMVSAAEEPGDADDE